MSVLALCGAMVALSPNEANITPGVVTRHPISEFTRHLTFAAYKPGNLPLGYQMTSAETMWLTDANHGTGYRQVLVVHYTNRASFNSFDLIQTPRTGLTTEQSIRQVLKTKRFEIPFDDSMTFQHIRHGNTEVGFVGSIISGPSAQAVLKEMVALPAAQ